MNARTVTSRTERHVRDLVDALELLEGQYDEIADWATELYELFRSGGRLLVAGNGGSAALASHLTGELVGRYLDERPALPAIWLGADQPALTAIMNDYGADHVFVRQIEAFATPGDVLMLLSSSGRSTNLLSAAASASRLGAEVWSLTGGRPNPLADLSDKCMATVGSTALVQEVQQVILHLLCAELDECIAKDHL